MRVQTQKLTVLPQTVYPVRYSPVPVANCVFSQIFGLGSAWCEHGKTTWERTWERGSVRGNVEAWERTQERESVRGSVGAYVGVWECGRVRGSVGAHVATWECASTAARLTIYQRLHVL